MSYRIVSFDGLATPFLRQSGDEDNMGTGSAQTDFRQTPGGGFYRMRRGKRGPQGIRPVTKSGVLRANSGAEMRAQIDAWRAKVGVYGKLTVRFSDGSLRWQWAELQDFDAPVANARGGRVLPVTLTWQTAAQYWNGRERDEGWTWGDLSWIFGDGQAEFGQVSYEYTLAAGTQNNVTVGVGGNLDVSGLTILYTPAATQSNITVLNQRTGQRLAWTGTLAAGEALRIRTTDMAIARLGPRKTASPMSRTGNTVSTIVGAHGLSDGDTVEISETEIYDGIWPDVDVSDPATFSFPVPSTLLAGGSVTGGKMRKYTGEFAATTLSDPQRWMTLKTGDNAFTIYSGASQAGDTVLFDFYDAWA